MTLPALGAYPDAEASWTTLSERAADLKSESTNLEEAMEDARASWRGLESGYQHPDTQDQVWTALDELVPHAEDWATALSSAQDALDDFVETGRPLQIERESLDRARPGLSSRRGSALGSADEALVEEVRQDILTFNERASTLTRNWQAAQETFTAALEAIRLGTTEGLPVVTGHRDTETGALEWARMTSGLDEKFGEIDPDVIWRDLRGLDEDELRDWLEANPEAARALAEHRWADHPPAGTPEAIMDAAMDDGAPLTEEGIAGIREAWLGLTDAERERMSLLYPGVIGVLNGVPLATRGRTNQITVAGLREQTAEKLAEHRNDRPSNGPGARGDRLEWEEEEKRLETVLSGLNQAWDAYDEPHFPEDKTQKPGYSTVYVSTDGLGQIATMRGEPSGDTERAVTFVPGTNTTIASVDHYNNALNAMDGDDADGTVSIYWQGAHLPQDLVRDNATPHYNEEGAPLLAAFDHAADLEMASDRHRDVPTTYVGHSAGGSLLGTAEREGLDSTNIVYVAPAGNGHEVSSPEDTENEYAYRYLIQTNDDPISWAQVFGGGAQSGSFWEGSHPVHQMGAVRLESGLRDDGTILEGHTSYFEHGSTSARNIEGVVYGEDVYPYLEPDIHTYPGSYHPVITYPLEQDLEHYQQHGIPLVPVESLHDAD